MAQAPTKPGRGGVPVRNALEDTLCADALPTEGPGSLAGPEPGDPGDPDARGNLRTAEPSDGTATKSILAAERYRLGAELGRGGMGRVVEAFDLQLGRTVALKEVLPRVASAVARRFVREVQLTARLEHPSIIPLYDAGTTADGRPFYVMRRVSGRPLDELMAQARGLGARLTLLPAVLAAIDAVAHAHRRGVIHRDLKPANILVGELGETVVIDWGLAKVIGEDDEAPGTVIAQASDSLRTQLGSVFGTPGFMAPEQARGEALDPRGDVYALGATLYQLLAGAPPHAGTSATEVIANTGTREVTPVDVVAPGAPPELVAIVGKALAFDPAGRYPDAGALGEDVRRFLAGQLVAAHRYTRRQRVGRFARRHRAPLSVAALAMAALAVLAWVGVHSIVQERDAANAAREAAAAGRAEAEAARDELQHRADQLVVMQARGLVDRNPTHAAAVLKELPDTSSRLGEARAVAQAAIVRGTAWTIPTGDELTVLAELSPDGGFLLQVSRDGLLRVWDLDRRRLVVARQYPRFARGLWVGKAVLVISETATPELIDPFAGPSAGPSAGAIQPLAVGPITWAVATTGGDRVAYLDGHGAANLLDVATRTARPLWPGHAVGEIAIAGDGSWIALGDQTTVAVLDGTGRELTRHRGPALRLFGSRFGEVGYATADKVLLCKISPQPVWTEVDLAPFRPNRGVDFVFRGHELDLYMTSGKVLAWNGTRLWERLTLDGLTFRLLEADRELLVAPGNDGQLHFANDLVTGVLHLPVPLENLKVFARPGAPRIVALGTGLIVGFDLADSIPVALREPLGTNATFVDDDTLLLWRVDGGPWRWYDVRTRVTTPFPYDPQGLPAVIDVDPSDGRVLVRDQANDASLVLLHKATAGAQRIARGPAVWGRLLPHGAIVFGTGDGRVLATTGAGPPREVAKLDGIAENAVGLGAARFAAVSSSGELVRGNLATNDLTHAHVQPGTTSVIAADRTGRVLVAQDDRLMMWDRDVVQIARLDKRIIRIEPIAGDVLLELADHAMVRTALAAGAPVTSVLGASKQPPLVSGDGRLVIGQSVNDQLAVIEPATQATWDLPAYYASFELMTISPATRRFVQAGYGQLALWTLPLAPPALGAWLDERTNAATNRDHALVWSPPAAHPR